MVILEKNLYDRIIKDITHSKVITPSSIVERHHTNCSVARSVLEELSKNGVIRKISGHHLQKIYASIIVEVKLHRLAPDQDGSCC